MLISSKPHTQRICSNQRLDTAPVPLEVLKESCRAEILLANLRLGYGSKMIGKLDYQT